MEAVVTETPIGEIIKEMISPELVPLVVVLYLIGMGIRNMDTVDNRWIPLILGAISIVLTGLWVFATTPIAGVQDILLGCLTVVIQGVLLAGGAVYFDQFLKQMKASG